MEQGFPGIPIARDSWFSAQTTEKHAATIAGSEGLPDEHFLLAVQETPF